MSTSGKIAIAGLLWVQALFLVSTFQTFLAVFAATILATLIVLARHQRSAGEVIAVRPSIGLIGRYLRWMLLLSSLLVILLVTVLWRLRDQSDAQLNALSVAVDALAHWAFFTSLLLWALLPNRGHAAMLGLGLVVLLLCVAAGGTSRSMASQTSIALTACLGFTIAAQTILGSARRTGNALFAHENASDQRTRWMGRTMSLTTISLILMTTGAVANTTNRFLPNVQQAVQRRLQETFDVGFDRARIGGTRYVQSGRLGSVRQHMTSNPTEITLSVDSTVSPGYLRGRVYDLYQHRRWQNAAEPPSTWFGAVSQPQQLLRPSSQGQINLRGAPFRPLSRFEFPPDDQSQSTAGARNHIVIHNNPIKGYVVFTPLATVWIEASSRELLIDDHGVIRMGIDITKPYVAGVARQPRVSSLTTVQRQVLTSVPVAIDNEARRVAQLVCPKVGTARVKAAAISRFFQAEYDYSLRPTESPPGVDPIAYFLQKCHPAHCEYFASATVAILRAAGVPARYVTGYVVDERHDSEPDLWLARNQDAHAWAEAYDDQTRRWFAVESTPGRTYQTVTTSSDKLVSEGLADENQANDDNGSGSLLGQAWDWLRSRRATDALFLVFQLAQLPLFLFLVAFWWVNYRRTSSGLRDEMDVKSAKMLRKVDRSVRKHALTRRPSETLCQFADRIEMDSANRSRRDGGRKLKSFAPGTVNTPAPVTEANCRKSGEIRRPPNKNRSN